MLTVAAIAEVLDELAPPRLAEEWDNVGLLVGDKNHPVRRLMTCLTITPDSVAEAVDERVDLIVTHHPLPFRPLKRLTSESNEGRMLLALIAAGVSVYSSHTALDSAARGINQRLAEGLGLVDVAPLVPAKVLGGDPSLGSGRWGRLQPALSLSAFVLRVKTFLSIDHVRSVGPENRSLATLAVACGSAGELLAPAREAGCDALLTGECSFHTCLDAESSNMALVLSGHYASERFGVESLAEVLADRFNQLTVWASRRERDPLRLC